MGAAMSDGRPGDDELVFPAHDGQTVAPRRLAGLAPTRLRGRGRACRARPRQTVRRPTFVRVPLIAEGRLIVEVARQAGHSGPWRSIPTGTSSTSSTAPGGSRRSTRSGRLARKRVRPWV